LSCDVHLQEWNELQKPTMSELVKRKSLPIKKKMQRLLKKGILLRDTMFK